MTTDEHTRLVRHFLDDFGALQDAALAATQGTASPQYVRALKDPALAGPVVAALAHADVLARGDVRRGELERLPDARLRALRQRVHRVQQARSRAEAAYRTWRLGLRGQRARTGGVVAPLELRLLRAALPEAYAAALAAETARRGVPVSAVTNTSGRASQWAREHGLMPAHIPDEARALLDCSSEDFVQALLADAREAENPHLPHDAVVERWSDHTRVALAWGRYAIARAERTVVTAPFGARGALLNDLEDAYQDMAVLTARAREAKHLVAELRVRVQDMASQGTHAELVAACHTAALRALADAEPAMAGRARDIASDHELTCPEHSFGCPRCHPGLAAALRAEPSDPSSVPTADLDPAPDVDVDEAAKQRYAILDDLPVGAIVAVADAAIGNESALCGYGWAAEDGTAARGFSYASGSGEAEVIGVCEAALTLLALHPGTAPIVLLCDSHEAVITLDQALATGTASDAHRTVLLPEGRDLLDRVLPHRTRLQVRWLKGHIGHDLNETADRLAGIALAEATARMSPSVAQREADRTGSAAFGNTYRPVA